MNNKEFIHQRICVFSGEDFDPLLDDSVTDILRRKFDVYLPQRCSLKESLLASRFEHEIVDLILQYRDMPIDS